MGFRARFFVLHLSHNNNEMLFLFPWMTFLVLDFTHKHLKKTYILRSLTFIIFFKLHYSSSCVLKRYVPDKHLKIKWNEKSLVFGFLKYCVIYSMCTTPQSYCINFLSHAATYILNEKGNFWCSMFIEHKS